MHAAVLRYGREVAFATAEVYARAAEVRGAWDARLEALVVDSVLRAEADETVLSRASALGWAGRGDVAVVLGAVPAGAHARPTCSTTYAARRGRRAWTRCAPPRATGSSSSSAAWTTREGGRRRGATSSAPARSWSARSADDLSRGPRSARAALSAHRAATGWPEAPRPVRSDDLLPERALAGDGHARRHLVDEVYLPLAARPRAR